MTVAQHAVEAIIERDSESEVNCTFDKEQWTWHPADGEINYGVVSNLVQVETKTNAYNVWVRVPQDLHKFLYDRFFPTERSIVEVRLRLQHNHIVHSSQRHPTYFLYCAIKGQSFLEVLPLWGYTRKPKWSREVYTNE